MMLRTDFNHLPWPIQQELRQIGAILFEAFEAMVQGRCSEHLRRGRVLALILHRPDTARDWESVPPGEAFHFMVIVNKSRLARSKADWRIMRDRFRRAWEFGEITRPVRLAVEGVERVNRCLANGIPYYSAIMERGVTLFQTEGLHLQSPRRLPSQQRAIRGAGEYLRWHERGQSFLAGAAFFRSQSNAPMAALLLHQACEHFYLCVLWTLNLHGPRTHALDELRDVAETLDRGLREVWPRDMPFERRAFGCICRAYLEARYGRSYRISSEELEWAFERVEALKIGTKRTCLNHLTSLIIGPAIPMLSPPQRGGQPLNRTGRR